MIELTPTERRSLRTRAHALRPVVSVGQHGLTPAVVHEIDIALAAHELIKVRVHDGDRVERDALLARICDELGAAPVQHLGKLLIVYRPKPQPPADKGKAHGGGKPKARGKTARKPSRTLAGRTASLSTVRSGAGAASKKSLIRATQETRRRAEPATGAVAALAPDAPRRRRRLAVIAATGTPSARNEPTVRRRRKNP